MIIFALYKPELQAANLSTFMISNLANYCKVLSPDSKSEQNTNQTNDPK